MYKFFQRFFCTLKCLTGKRSPGKIVQYEMHTISMEERQEKKMAYYLVDYENVKVDGMSGVDQLEKTDSVCIFYSENASTLTFELHESLNRSQAAIVFQKVEVGVKNALDFQLSTYLGYLISENEGKNETYYIVSEDKGLAILTGYWAERGANVETTADIASVCEKLREQKENKKTYRSRTKNWKPKAETIERSVSVASKVNRGERQEKQDIEVQSQEKKSYETKDHEVVLQEGKNSQVQDNQAQNNQEQSKQIQGIETQDHQVQEKETQEQQTKPVGEKMVEKRYRRYKKYRRYPYRKRVRTEENNAAQ